jgi:hypothetical protein
MVLIGLSGYGGAGKDVVASVLVSERGFERRAFADPMREALYRLDPLVPGPGLHDERLRWLVDTFGWDQTKRRFPEVRRLLQMFGVECGRDLHGPDCWVNITLADLPETSVVISDVRFPNEADRIRSLGGTVWRISRPGVGPVNAHLSDRMLDDWPFDHHLINDGTVGDLERAALELSDSLRAGLNKP